eukprot:scaffold4642_cov112-Cylindrotheca_fusiformis.AAC.6
MKELVAYASHEEHAGYRKDISMLFFQLDQATQGTTYASSIAPFRTPMNGAGAWHALMPEHASPNKWRDERRRQADFMGEFKWHGNGNRSTLEDHVNLHRQAYATLLQCAEHAKCSVPDERFRIIQLLDSIQNNDTQLTMAKMSFRPYGEPTSFEEVAEKLLLVCPVMERRRKGKRNFSDIS